MVSHLDTLYKLSLREMVDGMRERRFGASALMRSCLARIAARDAQVQAWAHIDHERAMTLAESADAAASEERGALHGVPLAIKDIIDVAGMPTRYGSRIYESAASAVESAECVQALERAGAIPIGKSVTTEFAYYTPGKTRNPWNPAHTPGGSSMGSAASVACGMVPGALGTQTNGSVIRPAAFCGAVGYKPSLGSVSNHGTLDPWPTLDHTGVFARNVGDAALLASVVAKPGVIAPVVLMPAHALKLAVVRSPVWGLTERSQRDALENNAAALGRAGATVDTAELPRMFEAAHKVQRTIMAYEGARHFGELRRRHRDLMSARFNALVDEGAGIAERDYRSALAATQDLRLAYSAFIAPFDALITPPAPGEAPATLEETGSPAFCTIWTLLGVPAITIPVGLGPAGVPLGLQVVGAAGEDDRTLASAAWCESHLPFGQLP